MTTSAAGTSGFDVLDYLIRTLPAQLRLGSTPVPREAVIQFLISDVRGVEVSYRVRGNSLSVDTGVHDCPDMTLVIRSQDLEALTQNQLDVASAVKARRLKVHGDAALLRWVAERLQPEGTH